MEDAEGLIVLSACSAGDGRLPLIPHSGFRASGRSETQAVFVPLDFRWHPSNPRGTLHVGRREKAQRSVARSAGGADPVVKSPLRKWPVGRFSYSAADVELKTARAQALGGSNPSPSVFGYGLSLFRLTID